MPEQLPNRLRAMRKARGLTQQQLGAMVDCNSQQISKLETGALRLSVPWIARLATALQCEPHELLPESHSPRLDGEMALLDAYRQLDDEGRRRVLDLLAWLSRDTKSISS